MSITQFLRRQWITVAIVATMLCIFAGSVALRDLSGAAAESLPMEGKAYNFSLVNSNGNRVTLRDWAGKVKLVAFIYTRCNASCPVVTSQMVQLQNELKRRGIFGNDVEFISVTMDPTYDTGSVLRGYEQEFGVAQVGWTFLTGSPQAIDKTLKQYGIFAKKVDASQFVHTTREFLIDAHGNIRKTYGAELSVQDAVKDIESLLHTD